MVAERVRELIAGAAQSRSFLIGGAITLALALTAALSLLWTPYSATAMDIAGRLAPSSAEHLLGTDQFGRDVLSMLMVGARNSILVSVIAVGIGIFIGVPLGTLAAARGGWIDEAVMRLNDFAFAFPALLTAVMITALAGPGAVNAMVAIGLFNIPVFARLSRGAALGVWKREFVLAARAAARSRLAITLDHVLPNIAGLLLVQATIQFALAILAEAGLSYLGLGTQPPNPSWGRMLNEAQTLIYLAPQLAIYPGLAITLSVLGLNLLGDGLRDALDPRLRRGR
ncbi:peptide/nickel transport system permease protein [Rhodobium orientis]|uniref:Peptide ABC transporter permease n=1 Tax=Rhodobium orientis TaxID=34017 RepID=A0A327JDF2_9HYPH|nr:ABC transporter permease [Rhodobium orientis]MBB4305632.1 peptide/nickel transport system permease protein [Rhodobium orientis]MBK5948711.1 peptide ABC transporter permease [Rhodobium orientis]RAI23868.1 peptide ABC transporter permease [Rhodobium orientis]